MTELNVQYPATQAKPEPSGPGKLIHGYIDVTPHQGEDVHERYLAAKTEAEKDLILHDMPRATVTFHELPEGEDFFDIVDRPRDANGFALWDTVWIKEAVNLGTIEAAHGDEYDVETDNGMVRLKLDQFKPLSDLTEEEDATLQRLAADERAAARSITA